MRELKNDKLISKIHKIEQNILKLKKLEFHEIFHIFILLGSLCQYLCVLLYVI